MSKVLKRSLMIFGISAVVVGAIFCIVPIDMFDGEVTWDIAGKEFTRPQQISLSYYFGIGVDSEQLKFVKEFHLTKTGWLIAFIMIFGIPGLLSYRYYLKATEKEEPTKD